MKPDSSNYEIWIIDWLDGKLSDGQESLLMEFLASNPDIREEADSIIMARLSPEGAGSIGWDKLKKTPFDLTESQLEYLSAGHLEKDLSPEQEKELMQNLETNPAGRVLFERIQKTKLMAPNVIFDHKSRLKRITPGGRVIRYSAISLSAAAVILFAILNNFFVPAIPEEMPLEANTAFPDTLYLQQPALIKEARIVPHQKVIIPVFTAALQDSNSAIMRDEGPALVTIAMIDGIDNPADKIPILLSMSYITVPAPDVEDDRSAISKFLAHSFRSGILREKKATNAPIQSIELAEAGIEGLNKLLGWQMALRKTSDSTGELKSLYFSSRMLKFNAPVRKTSGPQ
jgi:hypothetical protein